MQNENARYTWNIKIIQDCLNNQASPVLKNYSKKKLKKLKSLKDNELFDYVYNLIKDCEVFTADFTPCWTKDNEFSELLRRQANEKLVRKSEWREVLEIFTWSVSRANPDSEILALAYSNRSHLFYEQRFYKECVRDIERALKCNPSNNLKNHLEFRRRKVEEYRMDHRSIDLCGPEPAPSNQNEHIKCASRAVKFATNEKWGPHVVATRDISIGEVVAVEAPYIAQVCHQFFHCHECLEMCYDLIGCSNCISAMYCGEECRLKAFEEYHKYECILNQYGCREQGLFLALTLKAILNYEHIILEDLSIDDVQTFRSDRYKEVSTMNTFKEEMAPMDLFSSVLQPIIHYHFLTKYTSILDDLNFLDKEILLKEMLVKNYMIARNNGVRIEKMAYSSYPPAVYATGGGGIFPFHSKFHRSCFPNTMATFYGKKMVIHALANIKKGEHVTIDYGILFCDGTREQRHEVLREWHYVCKCVACEKNWPMLEDLRKGTPVPKRLQEKVENFISSGKYDPNTCKDLLNKTIEFYNSYKITEPPTYNYMQLLFFIMDLIAFSCNITDESC